MRTDTNGSSERSRFDLAQRVVLWLRQISITSPSGNGHPSGPEYLACSNMENASKLKGKLLLTVGELDNNVDPASTMQVANALIKANKVFDFLVFPGLGHSAGAAYGDRKRFDFFVHHLLGVEPPDWNGE